MQDYSNRGFIVIPDVFSSDEIAGIESEIAEASQLGYPYVINENKKDFVRTINGAHLKIPSFQTLSEHPDLVAIAEQILESQAYIHQLKINIKPAFIGEHWDWHQDIFYWGKEDYLPSNNALSIGIFVDDVEAINSPLLFMPGSHLEDTILAMDNSNIDKNNEEWLATVQSSLKYTIDFETLQALGKRYGSEAATGKKGSILIFHSNVLHGSGSNVSHKHRRHVILTYNSMNNLPVKPSRRPEFLAEPKPHPIEAIDRSIWLDAILNKER